MTKLVTASRKAVIVCGHIAKEPSAISWGVRSEPVEEADSGWAFYCSREEAEDPNSAQVWSVETLLQLEPGLALFIDKGSGTCISKNAERSWHMSD